MPVFRIKPNPLPQFKILYNLPPDTWMVINVGGRGGGKSHEVSKWGLLEVVQKSKRVALLRDEQSTIAQSILHEFKLRFQDLNEKAGDFFKEKWAMLDNNLKNIASGMVHIFSKGFRTSKNTQQAALKSVADVDIAIVEEFEDIDDEKKFNTFADSIRKDGALIVINSNVPHKNHWFVKRYFNLVEVNVKDSRGEVILNEKGEPIEGWYQLEPKKIPGVVYIFSTFEDNPHLSPVTVSRYRAYGDPTNDLFNLEHWCKDILGLVSEGAKGRIYKGWQVITRAFYDSLPYEEFYGLDFGYSDDPVALVGIKTHNGRNYYRQIVYDTGLTNPQLAHLMAVRGVPRRGGGRKAKIYADSSEPKSIQELRDLGFDVYPADKGPDSVLFGIKQIRAMQNYYTQESTDLRHENEEYKWHVDSKGDTTDTPIDKFNHLKDAIRYGVVTHKQLKRKGKVSTSSSGQPPPVAARGSTSKRSLLEQL